MAGPNDDAPLGNLTDAELDTRLARLRAEIQRRREAADSRELAIAEARRAMDKVIHKIKRDHGLTATEFLWCLSYVLHDWASMLRACDDEEG